MQELLRTNLMLYIALTSFVLGAVDETRSNIFNVLDYGAFADGQHDDSEVINIFMPSNLCLQFFSVIS